MTARATAPNRSKARARRKPAGGAAPVPRVSPLPSEASPPALARSPAKAAPGGEAFEALSFVVEIPFQRAEAAVAAILSDLAEIVAAGAEKEADQVRAFRRKVAALPERGTYDSEADAALFKIENETVNRNSPEKIAARWARDFSASLRAALAELKSGDPEDAFERLALLLRTILAPTAGASSGLAELARGLQAREALSAGGQAAKPRASKLPAGELRKLRERARAIKARSPRLSWEKIAARLLPELEPSQRISAGRLARMLSAPPGEDSPARS